MHPPARLVLRDVPRDGVLSDEHIGAGVHVHCPPCLVRDISDELAERHLHSLGVEQKECSAQAARRTVVGKDRPMESEVGRVGRTHGRAMTVEPVRLQSTTRTAALAVIASACS